MTLHSEFLLLVLLTTNVLGLESTYEETHTVNTLLLGGFTHTEGYSTSMEVITSTGVCTPKLPPIPVQRSYASAVLIHNKILYCGGTGSDLKSHGSCNSYELGGNTVWREEPGMVHTRSHFSLSVVGQTVYAIGGDGDGGGEDTVESYTEEVGWRLEGEMRMDYRRSDHCTVVMESSLVVIGGGYESSSVDVIDTNNVTAGWTSMESMKTARWGHGCDVWTHEDNTGFLVVGGSSYDGEDLVSVEFYSYRDHSWIQLGSLVTPRTMHSVTAVNGMLVVSGGVSDILPTSVEYFNVTSGEWEVLTNLREGRFAHSGVSVPAKLLDC